MEALFAETDEIFAWVTGHSAVWIYLAVFLVMFSENLFPPIPGDTFIFVCGVYASGGSASWTVIYISSVIGTLVSVMALYYLGRFQGRPILASSKLRWLGVGRVQKVEIWFSRWGEKMLLLSRFLTGVRALMAVFAGIGNVHPLKMFIYSLISAAAWNFLVLYLALIIRRDWEKIDTLLDTYTYVVYLLVAVIMGVGLLLFLRSRRGKRR
jgi:membrane protein DedA with SNARE-associated domain